MRRFFRHFYFWVLVAIFVGAGIGFLDPVLGVALKPLGDAFIGLVKMLIGPLVFCTVVMGLAGAGGMKKAGRIGGKALLYFEVASSLALVLGLAVANLLRPGEGFNVDVRTLDAEAVSKYSTVASHASAADFVLRMIPKTFLDAFTDSGDLLQVLVLAILFGWGLNRVGDKGAPVVKVLESLSSVLFAAIGLIMRLAPLGACGAMAFTIGKYGVASLLPLAALMGAFYLTCALFVALVLGSVAACVGFNVFHFIRYIRSELLLVLGTSSSESALLPLMQKLERLGCSRSVVGLVVPSGYSFNLDGTNIYLTMAALFIAQALNIHLSLGQQLSLLGVAILTSKGASGVTGAGFITLAATLAVVPEVPVSGLALILGVDRFMSEARALTNLVGNGVATLVVSRWERELDLDRLRTELRNPSDLR